MRIAFVADALGSTPDFGERRIKIGMQTVPDALKDIAADEDLSRYIL